jgi:hypothetical protein
VGVLVGLAVPLVVGLLDRVADDDGVPLGVGGTEPVDDGVGVDDGATGANATPLNSVNMQLCASGVTAPVTVSAGGGGGEEGSARDGQW